MASLNIVRFVQRLRHPSIDSMREWPRRLRLNAAAATLAPTLFAAHMELARTPLTWASLTSRQKQRWIDMAATTLDVGESTARMLTDVQ